MRFMGGFWLNICTFIVSEAYTIDMMAAQASLISVDTLTSCIGIGFSYTVASKLSKLMVLNDIKFVKKLVLVTFTMLFSFGLIIGTLAYIYCDRISALLNNSLDVQNYLTQNIKWWAIYTPFFFSKHALSCFYRAIQKHRVYSYYQFFFNYVVQFVLVIVFMNNGEGSNCIWKAALIQMGSFNVVLIMHMFFLNLNKQHEEIIKTVG